MSLDLNLLKMMPFAAIDLHFAAAVCGMNPQNGTKTTLFAAAAVASAAVRNGHSCCDLNLFAGKPFSRFFQEISNGSTTCDPELPDPEFPPVDEFRSCLQPPWGISLSAGEQEEGKENIPLILDPSGRLYLSRYFFYEKELAERLIALASAPEEEFEPDPEEFNGIISFFQESSDSAPAETDWQKFAAYLTGFSPFTIITGGPGTGKTSVVAAVLALIISKAIDSGKQIPKIMLCAPTGKAQSRLAESIGDSLGILNCTEQVKEILRSIIDLESQNYACGTIQSLLKTIWNTPNFQRNETSPLPADILLVDEVSMVSLPLMCKLLRALKPGAKLILLGDKNQLASVDAGSVMADLCKGVPFDTLSQVRKQKFLVISHAPEGEISLTKTPKEYPLAGHISELKKARRYPPDSQIARICNLIKEGQAAEMIAKEIRNTNTRDFVCGDSPGNKNDLNKILKEFFGDLPATAADLRKDPSIDHMKTLYFLLKNHKILTPHNSGKTGVDSLNELCRKLFGMTADHAPGIPVMILENDRVTGLYNGDTGILWNDGTGTKVYFPSSPDDPAPKSFFPYELPKHEPVFAMTIHKSQGDGFDQVLLLLPDSESPVLTRELIYTAISRAKKSVRIHSGKEMLEFSLGREVFRHSGLADRLRIKADL